MAAKREPRPLMAGARVVRLTPPGVGAVAVVLVEGPRATEIVAACFSPRSGRRLADLPIGRIILGRWGGPEGEELIVCRRTPDRVEVHPHGGRAAVECVVQDLVRLGAVEFSWKEWTLRNDNCAIRAAARIALADAPTQRTAAILLDQFQGALRRELELAIKLLSNNALQEAADLLAALTSRSEFGRHLVEPWRVVIAGPPNVGKSSLTNALVGYERAVVYDEPGTTRDVVTARTAIDGWPVELCDTAGLRTSSNPLEAEGVKLAQRTIQSADMVVCVLDATNSHADRDEEWRKAAEAARRTIVACNKIDLVDARQREALQSRCNSSGGRLCLTSAVTREGIDALLAEIANLLVQSPPLPGVAVPFEQRQRDAIDAAMKSLSTGDAAAAVINLQSLLAHESFPTSCS